MNMAEEKGMSKEKGISKDKGMSKETGMSREMGMSDGRVGKLYMETNEIQNTIIPYHRSASGVLTEVERCATDGAGSGTFKPISGQDSAPNSFEGAGSVILTPDRRFLFPTQCGRHSCAALPRGGGGRPPPL